MNDRNKSYFIKLILVSIIFVSLLTVFGLTVELVKNKPVINPQAQVASPEITTSSEIKDETADWKTYDWNNLEFKYPLTWTVEKNYYQTPAQKAKGETPENIGVSIFFPDERLKVSNLITIGGRQISCDPSQKHIECAYIPSISNYIYTDSINSDIKNIFDLIISTFRFIGTDEIADWKTYTNQADCYSIKYGIPYRIWPDDDLVNYDFNDPIYERGNPDGVKIQIQKDSIEDGKNFALQMAEEVTSMEDIETSMQKVSLGNFQYSNKVLNGPGGAFDKFYAPAKDEKSYYRVLVWGMENDWVNVESILKTFSSVDCK